MPLTYPTIGITARSDIGDRERSLAIVAEILERTGATVLLDGKRCAIPSLKRCGQYESIRDLDLLVILGGDGTILRAMRDMDDWSVPILSINRGTIGFLSELVLEEADTMLPKFLAGEGQIEERSLIQVTALRGTTVLVRGHVLNEAVIPARSSPPTAPVLPSPHHRRPWR